MRIGITYDLREDYGIPRDSHIFADFCHPDEIGYIQRAVERIGHEAVMIGNMFKLNKRILSGDVGCDMVLIFDEGISSRNREAIVPALLELNQIPYVGSDAYCMGLSQNKYHTKLVCEALGIRVPKGVYLPYSYYDSDDLPVAVKEGMKKQGLSFPVVVKPNEEGYSMGVFLAHDEKELLKYIREDYENYHEAVLIEEYIKGKELYLPIVGTGDEAYALPAGICRYEDGSEIEDIFTLDDKCFRPVRDEIPDLDADVLSKMQETSLLLYRHMECRDFGRCDFKLTEENEPVLIEINPRPGMTEGGPFENCARAIGKTYDQIMKEVIDSAIRRYGLES